MTKESAKAYEVGYQDGIEAGRIEARGLIGELDSSNEKYQKLEQLTKDLYSMSTLLMQACGRSDCFALRVIRERLESLGVIVE